MEDTPDLPCGGDHEFGQGGRCECGVSRADRLSAKRSGGAGALTSPLTDDEYRSEMRKLEQRGGR